MEKLYLKLGKENNKWKHFQTLDALVKPIEQELKFVSAATGAVSSFKTCLVGKYQGNKMFEDDTLKFGEIELR